MCCRRADLKPGAYVHPTGGGGLFRVQGVRPGPMGVSQVALSDESVPLDTERVGDVGGPASYRVAEPDPELVPTHRVLRCFELVVPAPSVDETASEAEFGAMGTAPE
jgi:hypothetical protein